MQGLRSMRKRVAILAVLAALACSDQGAKPGGSASECLPSFAAERAPELGPDDAAIASLRVTLETGTKNGAGTDNEVVIWFDNRRHQVSQQPSVDFAVGKRVSATFRGSSIPRTLGDLRRASIVLTLQLQRADIASSWYCEDALLEVRLEGSERFARYLESRDVGWLSPAEPPRHSTAYALQ